MNKQLDNSHLEVSACLLLSGLCWLKLQGHLNLSGIVQKILVFRFEIKQKIYTFAR